jgi:hypothetical protein
MEVFWCLHKQTNVFLHNCVNAIWSLKGPKGPPLCLGYFYLAKNFNHIAKAVTILHLKLGGSHRFSYFPTSTPLGHISHFHNWFTTSSRFLIWKNMTDLLQVVNFWHDRFWHLVWANLMSCNPPPPFFPLFFIPLYIFLIYSMSINKVL